VFFYVFYCWFYLWLYNGHHRDIWLLRGGSRQKKWQKMIKSTRNLIFIQYVIHNLWISMYPIVDKRACYIKRMNNIYLTADS